MLLLQEVIYHLSMHFKIICLYVSYDQMTIIFFESNLAVFYFSFVWTISSVTVCLSSTQKGIILWKWGLSINKLFAYDTMLVLNCIYFLIIWNILQIYYVKESAFVILILSIMYTFLKYTINQIHFYSSRYSDY